MIKAVLFDMDDTLLDINLTAFMTTYVADVSRILSAISGKNPATFGVPFARSYLDLGNINRADGLTNAELFFQSFEAYSGVPISEPAILDALLCYERDILPSRKDGLVAAKPMEGGLDAIEQCLNMGLKVALATNPSFSRACIGVRMGWAGITGVPFERVSCMENATRLKPKARYYEEFVSAIGLAPEECLMVGNDAKRDFPRPEIGMHTAYVGHAHPKRATWCGRMSELADALPSIVDKLN